MVWGAFHLGGISELVFVNRVDGRAYRDILENHLLPFGRRTIGESNTWTLMDDNATPHRANLVQDWKRVNNISTLPWPSKSPDLNPIEHLWDFLKRKIERQDRPPQTLAELRQSIIFQWQQIPPELVRNLVSSLPSRLAAVRISNGWYTRY